MNEKKKLNLLPPEAKSKYANKYLKLTAAVIAGFFILLLLIQYCQIGVLTLQTNKILADNQKYNEEKENIQVLKDNIANYEAFLKDYENDCFPFSLFMYDLEACRPSDVYIISVDSTERLINEGVQEETEDEAKKESTAKEEQEKSDEEKPDEETDEKGDTRTVLRLHPALAPFKAAVLPLSKKLSEPATEIFRKLSKKFMVDYDEAGSIGKRYRREDEIGTPVCITYDFDSETDGCVTVRDRDTMEQKRIPIAELEAYIEKVIEF